MKKIIQSFFLISMICVGINSFAQSIVDRIFGHEEVVIGTYYPVGQVQQCEIKFKYSTSRRYIIILTVPQSQEFSNYAQLELDKGGDLLGKEFTKMKQLMLEHAEKAKTNPSAYQKPKKIYTSKFEYTMVFDSYRPISKKEGKGISGYKLAWKLFFQNGEPYIYFEHAYGRYVLSLDNIDSIIKAITPENIKRCLAQPNQPAKATDPNVPIGIMKG